jgi:predicted dehydrogenase
MAIHPFDMARFVTAQDPLAVTCHEWNPPGSWYRHGANAHAFFEMTGGGVFSYRGSWCAEGHPTTWGGSWRIVGTRGTLAWNSDEQGQSDSIVVESVVKPNGFTSLLERRALPAPACPGWDNGHASLIAEFAACVRTGRTPPTHAADNLKSLAMVFGAVESAERGQRVLLGDPSLCPTT